MSSIKARVLVGLAAAVLLAGAATATAETAAGTDQPSAHEHATPQGDLSHRLNRSNGVIEPPRNVDPKMSAPVPNPHPHTTPVIPPPGSPGGNPDVQPK